MILAALAPALAFVLLIAVVRPRCPDARTALLVAAVLWGLVVVVVTEALSLFHALRFGVLLGAWVALSALLGGQVWRRGWIARHAASGDGISFGWIDRGLLASVVVVAGGIGVVAVAAPPNTYDSMTYHMSRVAHWTQNWSVEHYDTGIARQLYQPPWAEFAILQSYVLTRGDRLANLVQWLAMLGTLVGVSLVTKHLGGDRRAQILAAAVAVTIPVGVVQASGTKNDYVAAFWLTCLAVFVLMLERRPPGVAVAFLVALSGSALGLALLTKGTSYLFGVPFAVWACLGRLRRDGRNAWRTVAALILVAAAINAGYLVRNVARFGAPLGPGHEGPSSSYSNASLGVRSTISLAIRNAGLHLGTPWSEVNALTDAAIRILHQYLGLDVDDPATTWGATHFEVSGPKRHEDQVSNGLHLALIVVALLAFAMGRKLRTPDRVAYAAAVVVAFLLFCAVLRWQPWHGRLQLPLFVLWAPLIAIVLGRRPGIAAAVVAVLMTMAVVMVLANEPRPLAGRRNVLRQPRDALYFRTNPDLRRPYTDAVGLLAERRCARIGLHLGGDDWEYPLWVLVRRVIPDARLEHLKPPEWPRWREEHGRAGPSPPCGIVTTRPAEQAVIVLGGVTYRRAFSDPSVTVFLSDTAGAKQ